MYDVIVIGGGIGGTGVAALLAGKGHSVLLLEKNNRPGGRCTSYEKDGFKVPTYVHAFARADLGPVGELSRRIGEPLTWARADVATFTFRGKRVPMPISGSKREGLKAFRAMRSGWRDLLNVPRTAIEMGRKERRKSSDLEALTVDSWVREKTGNRNIHALTAYITAATFVVPPSLSSAGEYLHILRGMRKAGCAGYPAGECSSIPESYLNGFMKAGGRWVQERVQRILVEDGKARGVELANGDVIESRAVISNTGVKTTVEDLLDHSRLDRDYLEYVQGLTSSWSAMVIKVALDKKITDLPATIYIPETEPSEYFSMLEHGEVPPDMTLWVTIPSNLVGSLAPPGRQLICAGTLLPRLPEADWEPFVQKGFETLDKLFPGVYRHESFREQLTPAALDHRFGKGGPLIEVAQTVGQVGQKRPSIRSPVPGLYLAGSDTGSRAVGVELAAESALRCADEVGSLLGRREAG